MRLLWITNIPSPYRVAFFNELGRHCDLTVLFERRSSAHRDRSWHDYSALNFRAVFLRGIPYFSSVAVSPGVLLHLARNSYDRIVVTDFTSVTGALAVLYLRVTRRPYILESDGGFAGPASGFKWRAKRLVIPGAAAYFSTAAEHDQYYLAYGAPPDRIIRYPFSSVRRADVPDVPSTVEEKESTRKQLGIPERRVVLSIGRFIHCKGIDVLLSACAALPDDVGVYIVGGEPTEEYLRLVEDLALTNVHFVGYQPPKVLSSWFDAADVFVLPTRGDVWGLVVNEALAHGLPVVTTDRCIAGLELVQPGVTGKIVPVDDPAALAEGIGALLEDDPLRSRMRTAALERIRTHTVEDMVRVHLDVLAPRAATSSVGGGP